MMNGVLEHILLLRSQDDEGASRGRTAMMVTAVLTSISIVIVAMRIYTRVGIMKSSGREDWTILASLSLWAAIPMYNASLLFTKISLLLQYLRIFPSYKFRIICYIVMGVVIAYSTWAIVSGFVNCVPVAKFWDRELPGHCLSFEALWFFNASMNIATDLTLLVLPMPLITQLQLPKRQKLALMSVFALGGLYNKYSGNPTRTTAGRSMRLKSTNRGMYSQHDPEFGLHTIDTEVGVGPGLKLVLEGKRRPGAIEVTTEVIREERTTPTTPPPPYGHSDEGGTTGSSIQTKLVLEGR
ncbi:hypothetical protein BDW66DRAFT_157380 [Aspergillus desertorum]